MRIKPLADHVVLKNVEVEVTTASGLILAGAAGKEKPQFAEIVEVGPGGMVDGKEVKIEKQEYTIVRQSDILAILED